MKGNLLYPVLYFLMAGAHLMIWNMTGVGHDEVFLRYYLFLTVLFVLVLTVLTVVRRIYPDYVGFTFMGLIMFKLSMIFLVRQKLGITEVPHYKIHFIAPYLLALLLETLFAISLIKGVSKDEKNQ